MKRAYIVVGPESSGTRMMTKILIQAGCYGDDRLSQPFDYSLPDDLTPIVWRRSAPHGGRWPRLVHMASKLNEKNYLTQFIITNREWWPMVCSQVKNNHINSMSDGYKNTIESYHRILDGVRACDSHGYLHKTIPYLMVYYESLASETKEVLKRIMPMLDLKIPDIEVYDGNKKWYETDGKFRENTPVKGAAIVKTSGNVEISGNN